MKKIASSLITGLALAVSAFHATGQVTNHQPPAHPGSPTEGLSVRQPPQSPPIMTALDADRDGVISAKEIAAASAALLKLDKDNDKQLTNDEVRPARRSPRPASAVGNPAMAGSPKPKSARPQPALMAALDTDGDGTLSSQEIANAPATLGKMDKNSDGQLTRNEYRPSRPRSAGPRLDDQKSGGQDQPAPAGERAPRASRPRAEAK